MVDAETDRLRQGAAARRAGAAARARAGRQGRRRLERARHRRARRDRRLLRPARPGARPRVDAADLLVRVHLDDRARLARTSKDGQVGANAGVLEDYADVAEGFLALASVTGEGVWLEFAGFLLDHVLDAVRRRGAGALYDTAADAEQLIRRPQDPTDNAAPSGWTAAAGALLGYAAHTGSEPHRTAAERALGVVKALGPRVPRFIGWGLAVAEALLDGPREVAVVGPALGDPATAALHRTALLGTAPGAVVAVGGTGQ